MMQLCQILATSAVAFGTSGARGLVSDFSPEVCAAFTQAFIRVMATCSPVSRIGLGMDLRPSSEAMVAACAGAAKALGVEVDFFGVLPTPALACYGLKQQIPVIMVTGSHIPFDRNGLKFYRADGEITKADEVQILAQEAALVEFSPELPKVNPQAANDYIQRYVDFYPQQPLLGKRIGIYLHSSAGRAIYPNLFRQLGAEVFELEPSDHFVPIDTEAVSAEDKARGLQFSRQWQLDAIFSTDGDGDRPLLADEQGHWLRGDILGLLTAKFLGVQAIAVPVSCNGIIEKTGAFAEVVRTRIGSPYVIAAFAELSQRGLTVAGFEANGGFLLGTDVSKESVTLTALPTRDAVLPALEVLVAATSGVKALVEALPAGVTQSDRLQNIDVSKCKSLLSTAMVSPSMTLASLGLTAKVKHTDVTDGWRCYLSDDTVLHLRLSGNAPELRIYVEAPTISQADELLSAVLRTLPSVLTSIH